VHYTLQGIVSPCCGGSHTAAPSGDCGVYTDDVDQRTPSYHHEHHPPTTDKVHRSFVRLCVGRRDVRRTIKLANFVCQQNQPTKICRPSCKNRPNLSATKIVRFYCPSRTRSILDQKIAQFTRMPSCSTAYSKYSKHRPFVRTQARRCILH